MAEARESNERAAVLRQSADVPSPKVPVVAGGSTGSTGSTASLAIPTLPLPSPPRAPLSNGLRVASAAEVAEQLAKLLQSDRMDPAVPVLSVASLPNLVTQRAATESQPHAISATRQAVTDGDATQNRHRSMDLLMDLAAGQGINRVTSRLKPLQATKRTVPTPVNMYTRYITLAAIYT